MSFTKYNYYLKRQFLPLILAIFFILLAEKAQAQNLSFVVHSTHATRLIIHYLQNNPEKVASFQKMKTDSHEAVNAINENLTPQLEDEIDFAKPKAAILIPEFPIQSTLLTPGKVYENRINIVLPHPIFIVGCDDLSMKWLNRYSKRLQKLNATGFVANVSSQQDFSQLKNTFPNLPLLAVPANSIVTALHITHYPVLISDKLIEQ